MLPTGITEYTMLQATANLRDLLRVLVGGAASSLHLRPVALSTPQARAKDRYRRIALTGIGSALAHGTATLTMLVSVPLALKYLGAERYGLWVSITSFLGLLTFADLGLGNGLLNAISDANGRDDERSAHEYVSSAACLLSAVAVVLIAMFAVGYSWVSWAGVFNVSSSAAVAEAGPAMAVLACCLVANIPFGIVARTRLGYQEGFLNSLWQTAGSLLGLVGVLLAIRLEASLPWLVFGFSSPPLLAALLNGAALFGRDRPWLRPRWSAVTITACRHLFRLGSLYLVLQIAVSIVSWSDSIIIAQTLGAKAVAEYAIPMRLFSVPSVILSVMLGPCWPAYGEAAARGEMAWVRRTFAASLSLAALASGLASLALLAMGDSLIELWVGSEIRPPLSLMGGLAVWCVMSAAGSAVGILLNGLCIFRFQVISASLMASFKVLLSVLLAHRMGVAGAIWGTVIAYSVFTVIPCAIVVPRLLWAMPATPLAPRAAEFTRKSSS